MSSTASNTPYYKIAKKGYWYEWRHSYLSYHDVIYERAFVQSTCIFSNLSFSHLNFSHNQLKFHWAKRNWNYAKSIGFESRSGEFDVLKGQIITVAHPDVISKWRGSDLGLGVWLLFTKKMHPDKEKGDDVSVFPHVHLLDRLRVNVLLLAVGGTLPMLWGHPVWVPVSGAVLGVGHGG